MKTLATGLTLAVLLLTGACTSVYSREPVGTAPQVLEPDDWDGTWIAGNGSLVTVRVRDGQAGWLEMALVEDDDERLVPRVLQLRLREHDGVTYASLEADSLEDSAPDVQGLHLWARVRREEEQLIFWVPDVEAFEQLVETGALPGIENEHGDLVLDALGDDSLAVLEGQQAPSLFHWDEPLALIRIAPAR